MFPINCTKNVLIYTKNQVSLKLGRPDIFTRGFAMNNQFIISYELIALLQWIMEYDQKALQKLIAKALKNGLKREFAQKEKQSVDELQDNIADFFGTLEAILLDEMNEQALQNAQQKNLMPTIEHIDEAFCDASIVQRCIENTTAQITNSSTGKEMQEKLYQELIKQWKPNKKTTVH